MKTRVQFVAAMVAVAASAVVFSQTKLDRSFTANGQSCEELVWSEATLAKYPRIGSACQEVVQKDGKSYVKFEGEVKKVSKNGTELVMDMAGDSEDLVLNPAEGRQVYVGGRKVAVKSLRPGDSLTFYVPEDQFTAAVMETPSAPVEEIPIAPARVEQVAMTTTDYSMPDTASPWPLLALGGLLALGAASALRARRTRRGDHG